LNNAKKNDNTIKRLNLHYKEYGLIINLHNKYMDFE